MDAAIAKQPQLPDGTRVPLTGATEAQDMIAAATLGPKQSHKEALEAAIREVNEENQSLQAQYEGILPELREASAEIERCKALVEKARAAASGAPLSLCARRSPASARRSFGAAHHRRQLSALVRTLRTERDRLRAISRRQRLSSSLLRSGRGQTPHHTHARRAAVGATAGCCVVHGHREQQWGQKRRHAAGGVCGARRASRRGTCGAPAGEHRAFV